MTTIGFDTSLPVTMACVLRADGSAVRTPPPSVERLLGPANHSQELLPELERLLAGAGVSWDQLDSIAVGVGPGTFTGLRIGIATARALAQALRLPLHPVSSLAALAAGVLSSGDAEREQPVLSLIDARRGQVFAALYGARSADDAAGALPDTVWPPFVADPDRLLQRVTELTDLTGAAQAPLCAGDWALESRAELERAGAEVLAADSGLHAVDALHVCRLGLRVKPVAPDEAQPVYLRLPDAEIGKRLARDKA